MLKLFASRERGARVADAGFAINPNYAPLYATRSVAEIALGRFEQAKTDVEKAMRLSPCDPAMGQGHFNLSVVEFESGHFDAAIDDAHKAIDTGYRLFTPNAVLAAAYAFEVKTEEAKAALAEARRLNPNLTMKC